VFYAKRDLEASNLPTENKTVNGSIFRCLRDKKISHLIAISYKKKRIQRQPKLFITVEKDGVQKQERLCFKDGPRRRKQVNSCLQLANKTKPPADLYADLPKLPRLSDSRTLEIEELSKKWDLELPPRRGGPPSQMYQSDADSSDSYNSSDLHDLAFLYGSGYQKKDEATRLRNLSRFWVRIEKDTKAQDEKLRAQTSACDTAETSPIKIFLPGQACYTRDELEEVDRRISERKFRENTAEDSQDEDWDSEGEYLM
jgi:hypothetical protein